AKRAKLASVQVPSISGAAVNSSSKQPAGEAPETARGVAGAANGGAGARQPDTGPATIPAPVPPAAKTGGIRLKLL
ncbi:hypothetical protein LPJ61_006326, partial [Coemansia biformis]